MSREDNIKVFEDTVARFKQYESEIKNSNDHTQVILQGAPLALIATDDLKNLETTVIQSKTFDAARALEGNKVAVINFASATTPGGGVTKGATAQEECLCRSSTLYATLSNQRCWNEFYKPHRENLNALHNDDIIWTPDVVVFKDDDYNLLDEPKRISVITCAAPNLREKNVDMFNVDKPLEEMISNEDLFLLHVNRAKRIFKVADKKGVDVLVAGAFGCGAFKNDPEVVAKAWKLAAAEYQGNSLKKVVFAIYDGPYSNNFEIFKKVFEL